MKYHCGHEGCDICGARTCSGTSLGHFREYRICDPCLRYAIATVVGLAERLGGTIIDASKSCGYKKDES